ncbi:hypothetical protein OKW21_003494 [Catalinimonas alkaloidigena]|uniref:carboxypeptidase-like regulatory domain-containing protein n=1 Tax=Catalinimonas alkaloidigena TaxID=1075417 RepID=UPI0024076A11|nr:carboxypeptidase-like regulatory domain-containing protein [Catalinimonas alkaloidigena]MDF9798231.1 hypothetical protein [Catalinimonas alkaloidigena]
MRNTFFLCLICLIVPGTLLAQQDVQGEESTSEIRLSGTIVDEQDEVVPYATISIGKRGKGVVSDEEGFFYIVFPKQDTLVLSTVAHKPQHLYFGDTATTDNYDLKIRLSEQEYALENVTIFAFKDEYAFKKAILEMELDEEEEQIHIPGSYYGPRREVTASPLNPVSFIAGRLNKRARYEREARRKIAADKRSNALTQEYNRNLVEKVTGLNKEKLDEFMMYCRMKDLFVERPNEYEVILAINQCYKDYQLEHSRN